MGSMTETVMLQINDNWPAFVYIGLMIAFSICFLRERRAETEALKNIGVGLHERMDRVERLIKRQIGE